MLSKTSIVIMGILYDQELSAYDILKKLSEKNIKYWMPIGNTTLYEAALRLEKKSLIRGNASSNKTVYSLTEQGKQELKDTISSLFLQMDYDTIWFSLATLFCHVLEKNELEKLIQQRRVLLKEYRDGTRENLERARQNQVPSQGICTILRMIEVAEMELRTLDELEKYQDA